MNIWETIRLAFDNVRVNKLRSLLTMIGIVFGVAAVVTVVSIGQAGQKSVMDTMSSYKPGYFLIYPDATDTSNYPNAMFRINDIKEINKLSSISHAAVSQFYNLEGKNKLDKVKFSVTATTADIVKMINMNMIAGRYLQAQEVSTRQKVIVIDKEAATKLFGSPEQAIQRKINFEQGQFKVIGVYDAKKSVLGNIGGEQFFAYIPLEALPTANDGTSSRFDYLEVTAADPTNIERAIKDLSSLMAERHHVPLSIYQSVTAQENEQMITSTFGIIQLIIGSIAAISLIVGGIGVMNIMLVSVTERTREIGIRKAIGATPNAIRIQFLIESMLLSFIGGVVGILFGLLASYIYSIASGWPYVISIKAIVIAFVFSSSVGVFFGFYPANKASKLHPIEALRYE
ncbi:MAG: ABC transporter permease [Candidatus Pristimantibacillus lignocellulolyticus]|uniref:ABC transporter permease n=1 Tax=Candidatus Pristimantibacillus lignocellulolyticus TaxID=2994561 RepID=A0A9J6ZF80_9BACL|nr:MAG: ABC transporter permease [Candidatus Pristimantibacillus lignocellulolyticus]